MVPFYRRDLLLVVLASPHPSQSAKRLPQPEHGGGKGTPLFKKKTYRLLTVLADTLVSFLGLVLSLFRQGRWY